MLIDSHAHLYWQSYKNDLDRVIKHALENGVTTIINAGVDVNLSKVALNQVENELAKYLGLTTYCEIAIHPHEAIRYFHNHESIHKDVNQLKTIYLSNPKKVVAIGECGLDYLFSANDLHPNTYLSDEETKSLQIMLFEAQINLAKELNLPLVIHVRDDRSKIPNNSEAWDKALEMIGNHPTVLHCYSGLLETTKKALEKPNIIVSFAANITYPKNEYLREAAKQLPLEKIILETDAPFLAPQSKRGQRNEPSSVKEVAQTIAQVKELSFEEVAEKTSENARKIFRIP